jgi:ABC-type sugar transport system substrate-binding protein
MVRLKAVSLLLVFVVLASLAACGGTAAPAPTQGAAEQPTVAQQPTAAEQPTAPQVTQTNLTFGLAVHSNPAEDAFWAVVERGAKDAADTYGIT